MSNRLTWQLTSIKRKDSKRLLQYFLRLFFWSHGWRASCIVVVSFLHHILLVGYDICIIECSYYILLQFPLSSADKLRFVVPSHFKWDFVESFSLEEIANLPGDVLLGCTSDIDVMAVGRCVMAWDGFSESIRVVCSCKECHRASQFQRSHHTISGRT